MVSANCLHCYAESVTCRDDVTETRMRVTHQACILRNYAKFCWCRCLIMGYALGDALPVWWLSCQVRWAVVASALVVCVACKRYRTGNSTVKSVIKQAFNSTWRYIMLIIYLNTKDTYPVYIADMEVWLQLFETTALDKWVIYGVFWSPYTGVSKEATALTVVTCSSDSSVLRSSTSYPKRLGLDTTVLTSDHAYTFRKGKIQFPCSP